MLVSHVCGGSRQSLCAGASRERRKVPNHEKGSGAHGLLLELRYARRSWRLLFLAHVTRRVLNIKAWARPLRQNVPFGTSCHPQPSQTLPPHEIYFPPQSKWYTNCAAHFPRGTRGAVARPLLLLHAHATHFGRSPARRSRGDLTRPRPSYSTEVQRRQQRRPPTE